MKREFSMIVDPNRLRSLSALDLFLDTVRKEAVDLAIGLKHTSKIDIAIQFDDGRGA